MSWRATLFTLFPAMFPGPLGFSLAGRALERGDWSIETVDLREYGTGRHRSVDDTPFGGGAGMVMRADVVDRALAERLPAGDGRPVIFLTPRGRRLGQADIERLARQAPGVALICGRYEGLDERVLEKRGIEQVCIGDYVLSGGEPAALVLLDAAVRLLPGVMGSEQSGVEESFATGLLEYPHYTRPAVWEGLAVPDVLLSGDHQAVSRWRREQAERVTQSRRPDLWDAHRSRSADALPGAVLHRN